MHDFLFNSYSGVFNGESRYLRSNGRRCTGVRTQQVTKEIQGVEVKSMIEWTVDKNGEGPMKAYKNLDIDQA